MKKFIGVGLIVVLLITSLVSINKTLSYKTELENQHVEVFSFDGESDNLAIHNGVIIITPTEQTISGGELEYKGSDQDIIDTYTHGIYLGNQGKKNDVLIKSVSFPRVDNNQTLYSFLTSNKEVGKISGSSVLSNDTIHSLKDDLYFGIDYVTYNGEERHLEVKLKVKEIGKVTGH